MVEHPIIQIKAVVLACPANNSHLEYKNLEKTSDNTKELDKMFQMDREAWNPVCDEVDMKYNHNFPKQLVPISTHLSGESDGYKAKCHFVGLTKCQISLSTRLTFPRLASSRITSSA